MGPYGYEIGDYISIDLSGFSYKPHLNLFLFFLYKETPKKSESTR